MNTRHLLPLALAPVALLGALTGCTDAPSTDTSAGAPERPANPSITETIGEASDDADIRAQLRPAQPRIAIDGDFSDWPAGTNAYSDGEHLYLKLELDEADTLQAGRQTYRINLEPMDSNPLYQGVSIAFSPPFRDRVGSGVEITVGDETLRATDVDLFFGPTYASDTFELRLDLDRVGPMPTIEAFGTSATPTPLVNVDAPSICLPAAPANAIRVMSMNVLFASPMNNAEPFARLINSVRPDVLLLQEWQDRDGTFTDEDIESWFREHASQCGEWEIISSAGWGVVVASCHPISRFGPENLTRSADAPGDTHIPDRSVRFAGALIETPLGDVMAASVHLKCCGSADSREDRTRMAEALAINDTVLNEFGPDAPAMRIIGGDLNLVGSRPPMDALRASLDADGSDLAVAPTPVLNDGTNYTWYDAGNRFGPGRLDYILYSDGAADLVNAFAIDTERLEDACLRASGLERADSRATDHLVLVTDLRPVTNP